MKHKYSTSKPTVSVVGARGYTGLQLSRLLLGHPYVAFTQAFATQSFSLADELMLDEAKSVVCGTDDQVMHNLADIVFLCTPAEVSSQLAPQILAQGKSVIDLSHAFRHSDEADYGLLPFCGPQQPTVRLIANPGCYASAVQLALIPLLKRDLVEVDSLAIDAKSGTTGAGRKATEEQLFAEVDGECRPYRVGVHQHLPEIVRHIGRFSGQAIDPHFVTHLLPMRRGIECAVFAQSKTGDLNAIAKAFEDEYAGYPLVRHGIEYQKLAQLTPVVHSPMTHISYQLIGRKLYVFSVLDNLMKGAASQAVENLNRLLDLPITTALTKGA